MSESIVELRKCKTCGEEHPLLIENFRKRTQNGRTNFLRECRKCASTKAKRWQQENKIHIAAKKREKYYADIEKSRATNKAVYERRKLIARKTSAQYRKNNLQYMRSLQRECAKRRYANDPMPAKRWSAKQRAMKRNARIEPITQKQIEELHAKQRGRCAICRKKLAKWHIDHIMPLSKGGTHEIKNFQLLCPPCNFAKHASHPIDYMQKIGFLL